MDHLTEMLKGILEGCILEIISHKAAYGYEITRELHRMGLKVYALNAKGEAERIAFWKRWQFLTQTIEQWKKEQQNEEIL